MYIDNILDEKQRLEELINEVVQLLPEGNTFFASEKNAKKAVYGGLVY